MPAWEAITKPRGISRGVKRFPKGDRKMNKRPYMDIGAIFDDIFEAAKDFGERVKNFSPGFGGPNQEGEESRPGCHGMGGAWFEAHGDDNVLLSARQYIHVA